MAVVPHYNGWLKVADTHHPPRTADSLIFLKPLTPTSPFPFVHYRRIDSTVSLKERLEAWKVGYSPDNQPSKSATLPNGLNAVPN